MPIPIITLTEYIQLMQDILQRDLSTNEREHIQPCTCGAEYCRGWKTTLDPITQPRIEV